MKSMPKSEQLINQIIKSAALPSEETKDLKKELESHFFEAEKNLQISGQNVEETVDDFGDPKIIGKYIRKAHRKYEKIPILGDLVYYPPFRYAIGLSIINIILMIISPIKYYGFLMILIAFDEDRDCSVFCEDLTFTFLILLIPLIIAFFVAKYIYKKITSYRNLILLFVLSILPALCIWAVIFIPNQIRRSQSSIFEGFEFGIMILNIFIFNIFILIFYSIYKLIKKLKYGSRKKK